jgi:alpha-galactosidase
MNSRRLKKQKGRLFFCITVIMVFLFLTPVLFALENGLARTPPMGWSTWNCFAGNIDEGKIKQIADALVSTGMRDAGYIYLNIDDKWMSDSGRVNGRLVGDPNRFPSGMRLLLEMI